MTLKAMKFCQEMRSNLDLIDRSKKTSTAQYHDARRAVLHNLEQANLIYPPEMTSLNIKPGMSFNEKKEVLGIPEYDAQPTPEQEDFLKLLQENAEETRKANWIFRIGAECSEMCQQQWHGFFVTLTVDPKRCPDPAAMWKEGREWRKYIRKLSDVVTHKMGLRPARKTNIPESEYVRYVGVLEHGKSREHHHMHALIWMRDIPDNWKQCPNRRLNPQYRTRQRCLPLEAFWPWADPLNKPARYFRHEGDVWSRYGFCVPLVGKEPNLRPMNINPPATAGLYVAKYMGKDDKEWTHRVKATRNLGTEALRRRITAMNAQRVEALTWRPKDYNTSILVQTTHSIPIGLVRSIAKQILFCKRWASKTLDLNKELEKSCVPFKTMLDDVGNGARPRRMGSEQFYDWVGQHLPEQTEYSDQRFKRAHNALQSLHPVIHYRHVNHMGGNNCGFTQRV